MTQVPSFDQLMVPLFTALRELGGSASITEIDEKVGELLALPEETLELPHSPEKSNQTEFQYRLASVDYHCTFTRDAIREATRDGRHPWI